MYADIDLGRGFRNPVFSCKLSEKTQNTTKGMLSFKAPGVFDVNMPYVFVKEQQGGFTPAAVPDPVTAGDPIVRITPRINGVTFADLAWEAPCRLVYGKDFYKDRPNQRSQQTFSGVIRTYDSNLTNVKGVLTIRGLAREHGVALESFITETLVWNSRFFDVEVFE